MTTTPPQAPPATVISEAPLAPRPMPAGNLVPDLNDVDAFTLDKIAAAAIAEHAPWSRSNAEVLGGLVWAPGTLQAAHDAHRHLPELRTLDRLGNRIDAVDYHPAWHELMSLGFGHGVHALAWTAGQPGSHLARAVLSYLWNQVDGATACPTGMAYAALPMLRETPQLAGYAERVAVHGYDPVWAPIESKSAATVAYAMTEKQGGSDLRANVTVANPVGPRGPGEAYLLTGHKWFCSVPKADLIITVAQTQAGPSCFAAPRFRPDGTVNAVQINRLKDKLGNRANASAEIEYHDTYALLIGEEGRGVRTILSSSEYARLDFAVGSAGLIRAALSQVLHYNDRRCAFGAPLSQLPIQAPVLADLVLEWAAPHTWRSASPAPSTPATMSPSACSSASLPRSPNTGTANAPRWSPGRPSNASEATATSRSTRCRATTARRRSTRSGKVPRT